MWVQSLDLKDPPEEGNGKLLQYSCPVYPMDRRAWQSTVRGVAKESDTTQRVNNNVYYIHIEINLDYNQLSSICKEVIIFSIIQVGTLSKIIILFVFDVCSETCTSQGALTMSVTDRV